MLSQNMAMVTEDRHLKDLLCINTAAPEEDTFFAVGVPQGLVIHPRCGALNRLTYRAASISREGVSGRYRRSCVSKSSIPYARESIRSFFVRKVKLFEYTGFTNGPLCVPKVRPTYVHHCRYHFQNVS